MSGGVVTNVGIGAAAAATAVAAVFFNPFSLTIPGSLPPPPMEVVCESVEVPEPGAPPILGGCYYQGYPVAVVAPFPLPF
jgi:hypothetical protein